MKLIYTKKILEYYHSLGIDYMVEDEAKTKIGENIFDNLNNIIAPKNAKQKEKLSIHNNNVNQEKQQNLSSNITTGNIILPNQSEILARELANNSNDIDELKKNIENFEGCSLKKLATNTVFSDGNRNAKLMLIGEAPGAEEDASGIPFCGRSGKLLDEIFASIGFYREKNLYITNTIFWRPPGNRKPENHEINICRPFVEKHIALINPDLIIMVGSTAINSLFPDLSGDSITNMRRKFYDYKNIYLNKEIPATPIFHPSYLLRQASKKKDAWYDMLFIKHSGMIK